MGRDPRSAEIAAEMFPNAKIHCIPDFVLSLPSSLLDEGNDPPKVLLCLRLDVESALTDVQRQEMTYQIHYQCSYFDTTFSTPIHLGERPKALERTLELFAAYDVVVTDRYHGLVFAVLCGKPCVVVSTVDHKLGSAYHWFKDMPSVAYAESLDEVPLLVEKCLKVKSRDIPNWNEQYFDKLPELIGLR